MYLVNNHVKIILSLLINFKIKIMSKYNLIATSAFGLESVVSWELKNLGFTDLKTSDGKVEFQGDFIDIARCNIWIRTADRILIKLAEFRAMDFEMLYQGALKIPWEDIVPEDGYTHVKGKSVKSKLYSTPDCQRIVKRGIIDALMRKYKRKQFLENGPLYTVQIALKKDIATITLDTSGHGLHKRGYRTGAGEAPIKETLAAGLVILSRWTPDRIFADLMCGSGTIPIEAAMFGKNIAPGLYREFVSENWPIIPKKIWEKVRAHASDSIKDIPLTILASDHDKNVFKKAKLNAENAGVSENIDFQKKPLEEFSSKKKYGCVVCNPSYGERLDDEKKVIKTYHSMGEIFKKLDEWSFFIITPHSGFEKNFGFKSTKNRKLYNGKIKCYYYQYFGKLPGKDK